MAESTTYRLTFESPEMERVFLNIIANQKQVEDGFEALEAKSKEAFTDAAKEVEKFDQALVENVETLDEEKVMLKEARDEGKKFGDTLKGAARSVTIFGVNVGDVADKLDTARKNFKLTQVAIGGTTKALRIFKLALAATGIGAIVLALGSLVSLLTRTQRGIDFVDRVMAGLGATVDVVIDRLSGFGEGILLLFKGEFTEALDVFKASVSGIGEEIREEASAATELERRTQALREETLKFRLEQSRLTAELEEQRNISRDTNRGSSERAAAQQRAIQIQNQLAARETELARENLAILAEKNALGESLFEDREAEIDAEIRLSEIQGSNARKQREDQANLRSIRQQAAAAAEELRKKQLEVITIVEDANAALEGQGSEIELQYQRAIDKIKELEAEARQLGLSVDLSPLREIAEAEAERARDALLGIPAALPTSLEQQRDAITDIFGKIRGDIVSSIGGLETDFIEEGRKIGEALPKGIASGIGERGREIIEGQIKPFIKQQLQDIAESIFSIIETGLQGQISAQDALIDKLQESTDETRKALEEQGRLREQGFANDVSTLENKLTAETAALQAAEEERLALERKAAEQRLLLDSLQQASQLGLAVAKLLSSSASLGPFGIVAAATAGLAFIFSTISRAKALAAQFSTPQGFKEGTPYLDGPGGPKSDSIPAWLSRGERVVDAGLNDQIGGRQVSNKELVEMYKLGRIAYAHGMYELSNRVSGVRTAQDQATEAKQDRTDAALAKAMEQIADKQTAELIKYWKTRPIDTPLGSPILREWMEGTTKVRKVIRPKK